MDGKKFIVFSFLLFLVQFVFAQTGSKMTVPQYLSKSYYYVEIKNKIMFDALNGYIKKYESDFAKEGMPIIVIDNYEDSIVFYISAIIYRSDLKKYSGNYYTLINNIPILVYYSTKQIFEDVSVKSYFRKLFYGRLLNDLDSKGNINPDFIPVGFDPHNVRIKEIDGKLAYVRSVTMSEVYNKIAR